VQYLLSLAHVFARDRGLVVNALLQHRRNRDETALNAVRACPNCKSG
jgi:hypothetical protein